jgi:hypothetical protein
MKGLDHGSSRRGDADKLSEAIRPGKMFIPLIPMRMKQW